MTNFNIAITGAASGIGLALAQKFAQKGHRILLGDINLGQAEKGAAAIRAQGGNAIAMMVDHADEASIIAFADATFERFGHVDMVFANAGIGAGGPIYSTPQHNVDWVFSVNILGPLWLSRHFIPRMSSQGTSSRFIITGSEHSIGLPERGGQASIYTISKHAALGLAETLRRDLAGSQVDVSIICPAVVNTGIVANSMATRHEKFGGPRAVTPQPSGPTGIDPDIAASHIMAGVNAGEFYIFTHHDDLAEVHDARASEISGALERFKARST